MPGNQVAPQSAPEMAPMPSSMPVSAAPAANVPWSNLVWNRAESSDFIEEQEVGTAPVENHTNLVEPSVGDGAIAIEAAAGLVFAFALRGSPGNKPEETTERRRRIELT
jgi:hypothetical protein